MQGGLLRDGRLQQPIHGPDDVIKLILLDFLFFMVELEKVLQADSTRGQYIRVFRRVHDLQDRPEQVHEGLLDLLPAVLYEDVNDAENRLGG